MKEIKDALKTEQQIQKLINDICNQIDGAPKVSDSVNIVYLTLLPEYYSPRKQSKCVRLGLEGCKTLTDVKGKLGSFLETGFIDYDKNKYKLNPCVLSVLERYYNEF